MTAAVRAPYHQFNFNLASTTKYFPIPRSWCVFYSFNEISLLGRMLSWASAFKCYNQQNSDSLQLTFDHDTNSWTQGICLLHGVSGENCPPVSMDVLTNGVPNQGERDKRESEIFSTHEKTIYSFGWQWNKIADQKSFFWRQNTKRLVAEHGSFRAKPAKLIPRITSVLARKKQQAMDDRRFGKKFRRKNNDNYAVNVERFARDRKTLPAAAGIRKIAAKYLGHFWQLLSLDNLPIFADRFSRPRYFFAASFHAGIWTLTIRNVWRMGPFQ